MDILLFELSVRHVAGLSVTFLKLTNFSLYERKRMIGSAGKLG